MRLVVDSAQLERMAERLETVAARIDASTAGPGQVQTVVHKSDAGGFMTGIAVASCVATVFLMLAFMLIENRSYQHLDNQIDQLRAWSDVERKEIAQLKAERGK